MKKTGLCLFIAVVFLIFCCNFVYAMEASDQNIYKGIDVSEWQQSIDYSKVKADGIEVVYIKSSEGDNEVDTYFEENYTNAKSQEVIIYSDAVNVLNIFDSSLASYQLWIAEYGVSTPKNSTIWSYWVGFQHSDAGSISGISGSVDLDIFTDGVILSDNTIALQLLVSNEVSSQIAYTVKIRR